MIQSVRIRDHSISMHDLWCTNWWIQFHMSNPSFTSLKCTYIYLCMCTVMCAEMPLNSLIFVYPFEANTGRNKGLWLSREKKRKKEQQLEYLRNLVLFHTDHLYILNMYTASTGSLAMCIVYKITTTKQLHYWKSCLRSHRILILPAKKCNKYIYACLSVCLSLFTNIQFF